MPDRIAELEKEVAALKKINRVLIGRVERSVDIVGNDYSLFEQNIILQQRVDHRTSELEEKNRLFGIILKNLEESERLLDRTGRVAGVGGWQYDLEKESLRWTEQTRRIHEVETSFQPTLEDAISFYAPEGRDIIRKAFHECLHQGTPWDLELPFITAKGKYLWVRAVGQAYTIDGKIVTLYGAFMDNTAHHLAEENIRKLSEAIKQCPDTIYITDFEGRIEFVNESFIINTGYSREEVIGKNPRIFQSGKTTQETYDALWFCLKQGNTWRGEFINRRKDGSEYIEQATIAPIRNSQGSTTHYLAVKQDITERKRAEERLRQTNIQLQEATAKANAANIAKGEFLANMSHEIRTPMNGIIGMLGLLLDTKLDKEQRECADTAYSSAISLLSLLNDILDFSKIESGKYELESIDFNLKSVLANLNVSMLVLASKKGLKFSCETTTDVPLYLKGDPSCLRQILANLVTNAIKFTGRGEVSVKISVRSKTANDVGLLFLVRDTGIGIPENKVGCLFEKFMQVDSSTTRRFGGTGLGLAICKTLVDLMGGEIGVKSQENQGSEFWFTLRLGLSTHALAPAAPGDASKATPSSVGLSWREALGREPRFLLIEDDITNQQVALGILKKFGFSVDAASNGIVALKTMESVSYDLVFMDLQMPEMDGIEATRRIRDSRSAVRNHDVTIIAMTANAMQKDRDLCIQVGMNDYVSKPIMPDDLSQALLRCLSRLRAKTS